LGDHCVVGANSTVTRSFPSYSMIGGSPARLLKRYSHSLEQWVAPDEKCE
jgi:acetyltransferase-like isoleucine patch superfamily enzyme